MPSHLIIICYLNINDEKRRRRRWLKADPGNGGISSIIRIGHGIEMPIPLPHLTLTKAGRILPHQKQIHSIVHQFLSVSHESPLEFMTSKQCWRIIHRMAYKKQQAHRTMCMCGMLKLTGQAWWTLGPHPPRKPFPHPPSGLRRRS